MRKQSLQRVSQHLQGPNLSHVVHCIIAAGIVGNIGKFICLFELILYVRRVLESNSRSRGCKIEPNWRHCVVSLSKTLYPLLSTVFTQEDRSQHN